MERDFERCFSLSRSSISICRGVLFSFSSRDSLGRRMGMAPRPSMSRGCEKASSQLMRSSSRRRKQRRIKSRDRSEMAGSQTTGLALMAEMSWSSLVAGQGVNPCSISQQMSPTDQRSDLLVQLWWLRICGDMQSGVPTTDFRMVLSPLSRLRAKPKSLILRRFLLTRMLAGLRSRCMMSRLFMYSNPRMISRRKANASVSFSFRFFLRQFLRSPSSQNSVTMYMLLLVWQTSSRWTMFSCSRRFMISISQWMFLRLYWLAKMRLSITFTAAGVYSPKRRPRQTLAQDPFPSSCDIEKTYFSIFFSPYPQKAFPFPYNMPLNYHFIPSDRYSRGQHWEQGREQGEDQMKTLPGSPLRVRWYFRFSMEMIWLSTSRFDSEDELDTASFRPSQDSSSHSQDRFSPPTPSDFSQQSPLLAFGRASLGLVRLTMLRRQTRSSHCGFSSLRTEEPFSLERERQLRWDCWLLTRQLLVMSRSISVP